MKVKYAIKAVLLLYSELLMGRRWSYFKLMLDELMLQIEPHKRAIQPQSG